jgi:hypothetical protein
MYTINTHKYLLVAFYIGTQRMHCVMERTRSHSAARLCAGAPIDCVHDLAFIHDLIYVHECMHA